MHQFFVPIRSRSVVKPGGQTRSQKTAGDHLREVTRYRVFGMTARILVDAARLAYDTEPEFEHNSHFGDENMISSLRRLGRLSPKRTADDGLTRATMEKAAKLS